jgi:hypothetical protein
MGLYPSGAGCAVCAPVAGATQVKCYNGDTSLPVSCMPGLYVDGKNCSGMSNELGHRLVSTQDAALRWLVLDGSLACPLVLLYSMPGGCERDGCVV